VRELLTASPTAISAAKTLFARIGHTYNEEITTLTTQTIATQRTSSEGQDGLRAFLEKRPASWVR
jgi:methylglutaconyl-CoA hydratase